MADFITGLQTQVTSIVPDVAAVAVAALALFGLLFGIKKGINVLRSVAK